jgi:hypothetical protein
MAAPAAPAHAFRSIRTHPGWNVFGWVLLALAAAVALFVGGLAVIRPGLLPLEGLAAALALVGAWATLRGRLERFVFGKPASS